MVFNTREAKGYFHAFRTHGTCDFGLLYIHISTSSLRIQEGNSVWVLACKWNFLFDHLTLFRIRFVGHFLEFLMSTFHIYIL